MPTSIARWRDCGRALSVWHAANPNRRSETMSAVQQQHQCDRDPHQRSAGTVTSLPTTTRIELAHRSSAGIDVTLVWIRGAAGEIRVCVCDQQDGAYFEISAEPHLALDVYYHPFFYRDFSIVDYEDSPLAA
jgi:hypothetical protein